MHHFKSNKEVVAAGHQFAKNIGKETSLMDMAKMVTELASRLDVATVRANLMAGEVLRINSVLPDTITALQVAGADMALIDDLNAAIATPACDQWICTLRGEALGEARRAVTTLGHHQQPGISHAINIISQLEVDLLRSRTVTLKVVS
ncbi:hypothetical protein CKF43_19700 [Pantoea graminicola]|uniref:hypothetical protein n=1 Tax=Pantoea sp. ARC607 TaxID=2027922 RepID=UPI000DA997A4|nr:hypothetical protein [Pantoea sp. ARC607]PZL89534.1 hypothetical protein CKF43_19700 [Pantoea sp. ARC607]